VVKPQDPLLVIIILLTANCNTTCQNFTAYDLRVPKW